MMGVTLVVSCYLVAFAHKMVRCRTEVEMGVSTSTKIMLAQRSGNRCAFPDCRRPLSEDGKKAKDRILGEVAHIHGQKPGSARYREDMTDKERDCYDNLIYLCPTCHSKIDKQPEDYPAEVLFRIKREHEEWVNNRLSDEMVSVTFTELDVAARAIISGKHSSGADDFSVIPIDEKIRKNELSDSVRSDIASGLAKSEEVERFLSKMATDIDDGFPERLKTGFRDKYLELKQTSHGDELFHALLRFAQQGNHEFVYQAACLAILSYLFHICEVFEK